MIDFQQSSIWQRTLARQLDPDIYSKQREFLRVEFENFREKAKLLSEEISSVLPEYTVHNITHIDALWDTTELIVPKNFEINPAEAFVLGGAFLLHDLGMALAAYPKGVEELKTEQIWIDTVAAMKKESLLNAGEHKQIEKEFQKYATEKTLRLLHAKRAGDLANISWKNSSNQDVFLIDNEELRSSFGNVIGLIAYSHWIKVDQLEEKLPPSLGALSKFPADWTIDAIKLACIIRLADAMQIDDRRSPSFLRSIRMLSPSSELHWNFQEKLYQPRIEQNRVVYTSKSPFTICEVESWWTCYDTLKMIDDEIKQVDALLSSMRKERLGVLGVSSIEDTKRLSRLITVSGWQPVDAVIRVNNVAKLVTNIGGTQLYGNSTIVPLRELIQNCSDAIRARKFIENEDSSYGNICISLGDNDGEVYIEIEDNGIGMSQRVLTGPFLDFGQSFWGTELMHEELPGLESKGFKSTGKYGIGFFSLFMWSPKIQVTTNRYNKGRNESIVLEFKRGASSRPLLRNAAECEYIKDGGTRIRVWLKEDIIEDMLKPDRYSSKSISFTELIESLCPTIDCNVFVNEKGKLKQIIKANDWITMSNGKFVKRIIGKQSYNYLNKFHKDMLTSLLNNIELISNQDGEVIGRAALFCRFPLEMEDYNISCDGLVTIGGMKSSGLTGILGVLLGYSERASRDIGIPLIDKDTLRDWVNKQLDKIEQTINDDELNIEISSFSRALSKVTGNLKIAYHGSGLMNYRDIVNMVTHEAFTEYIIVQDAAIHNYERVYSQKIDCYNNVFWTNTGTPGIHQTHTLSRDHWPYFDMSDNIKFNNLTLKGNVIEAIAEGWGCDVNLVYSSSLFEQKHCIGTVENKRITMKNVSIIRRPQH